MTEEFAVDDLTDAVEELATGIYLVTRPSASVFIDGRRTTPPATTFEITAMIAPASGRQLERLPEGLRTTETIQVITQAELRTAGAGEPDVVSYAGIDYQVQSTSRWAPSGNFWEVLATKVPSR